MYTDNFWFTQKTLKRYEQIEEMRKSLIRGDSICSNEQILLYLCPDNEIEIKNGHHRCFAHFLAGIPLIEGEYSLVEIEKAGRRFFRVKSYKEEQRVFSL